jgi:hypothetical protein
VSSESETSCYFTSNSNKNLPKLPVVVPENCKNYQQRYEALKFGVTSSFLTIHHARFLDKIWNRGVTIRYVTVQITIIYTPLNYCLFHYRMIMTDDKSLTTKLLTCKCSFCPPIAQIILIRQASASISLIHDKLNIQINTSSNASAFALSSEDMAVFVNCIMTSIFRAADQSKLQAASLCCCSLPKYSWEHQRSEEQGGLMLKRHRVYNYMQI